MEASKHLGITYRVSDTVEQNRMAALTGQLYELHEPCHRKGQMVLDWKRIMVRKERRKVCIVLAYHGDYPVGAVICYVKRPLVEVYVKPSYRGWGIGDGLIKELRKHHGLAKRVLIGHAGFEGWEKFFDRNHILIQRLCGSKQEINEWAEKSKGSLLTFFNFKSKRAMLAKMRREKV